MSRTADDKEITKAKAAETGWGNLHYDILAQILRLLPSKDLVCSISLVCRHWKLTCGTILFWKDYNTLDLSPLILLGYPFECYMKIHQALHCLLNWETIEHHLRCSRSIIFAPHMHLSDSHLAFIAKRSPKLRKLVLPESYYITLEGISRIIQMWKELEELSTGPLGHDYSDHFLPKLGRSCKNLTTLHIFGSFPTEIKSSCFSFSLDEKKAWIMVKNLLQLKVFTIDKTYLHESGVWTLLSESKNLVELNLNCCRGVVDPDPSNLIFLKKEMSMEIRSCRLKDFPQWFIASSSADHKVRYTAQELVSQLWRYTAQELVSQWWAGVV